MGSILNQSGSPGHQRNELLSGIGNLVMKTKGTKWSGVCLCNQIVCIKKFQRLLDFMKSSSIHPAKQ